MISFIDLKTQQERIAHRLREKIDAVLRHGQYIMGPEVAGLEGGLAAYAGVKHCIAVASGTERLRFFPSGMCLIHWESLAS